MLYINENDFKKMGIKWDEVIHAVEKTVRCIRDGNSTQPIKPYLRYGDMKNRIIAMPAYVGCEFNISGIKWISSFPDNINKGIPRAHSVVILNEADTGVPLSIINTPLLSIIRTASVSGLVMKYFIEARTLNKINVGIIGFGPIGQYHLKMCDETFGEKVANYHLFDINKIDEGKICIKNKQKVNISDSWQAVYDQSDIFITCTVSKERYIDREPKEGSLHLNVSLRDYHKNIYEFVKNSTIVDNWEEICRENTDVEMMHLEKGLKKEQTKSIIDVVCNSCMEDYDKKVPIMFNPMGMAAFDIAIGKYYYEIAYKSKLGQELD